MPLPIRILELRSVRGSGGGPEKTILLGARNADPRRYAVTVCYLRDRRDRSFGVSDYAARLGVDLVEIDERHSLDVTVWPRLRQLVIDRGIDIVHAHEYKTDLLALMLARATGVAAMATVHGWTGHSWRERAIYYPADKRLLARFPALVAVSSEIADELVRHGARPDCITTMPNGIEHDRFRRDSRRGPAVRDRLGIDAGAFVIGAVGRLEPQKRFDLLLHAVARLRSELPRFRLVIAGDGSLKDDLHRLARDLDLAPVCVFPGHCGDVADLHNAFDLFVQSSEYEGTPNAVLEAMACQTPIVATDVGGTRELVTDGVHAIVVRPRDVDPLVAGLRRAIADRPALARRAMAARARVERELAFDVRTRKLEAIYDRLAATAAPAPWRERTCA